MSADGRKLHELKSLRSWDELSSCERYDYDREAGILRRRGEATRKRHAIARALLGPTELEIRVAQLEAAVAALEANGGPK